MKIKLWNLFEKPETSCFARIVSFISVAAIVISTTIFCVETLPQYHVQHARGIRHIGNAIWNSTIDDLFVNHHIAIMFILETFCVTWFMIEFIIRFACGTVLLNLNGKSL